MRKHYVWAIALVLVIALSASAAFAACPAGKGMGKMGAKGACPMWDAKTVKSIAGEILSVGPCCPPDCKCGCMKDGKGCCSVAVVKTRAGNVNVRLGPSWYLTEKKIKLSPKDKVIVVGSEASGKCCAGKEKCKGCLCQGKGLMAKEVQVGTETIVLRDDKGMPVWAGAGGHKMGTCPMKQQMEKGHCGAK